jgi:glutathione S-transferase
LLLAPAQIPACADEAAAITLHLADQHPQAGLAPMPGTPERAQFYKWMVHLTNTAQSEYRA